MFGAKIPTSNTQKMLRFLPTTLLWLAMKEENPSDKIAALAAVTDRLRILEEKFVYLEQTTDALNEVIIEQQAQLNSLEDQLLRLQALLSAGDDNYNGGDDPPPLHY